uniref:Uncharacterized protein n=1 Tax=Avena sativa TaxID=4498 RepID=A0ACD5VH22_AVESA
MISIGGSSSSSSSSSSGVRMGGAKRRGKPGGAAAGAGAAAGPSQTKWRSGTQERIYGRRLLDALRATRSGAPQHPQPRAVKEAADSALALTARGQSRWSRAILLAGAASCRRRRVLVKAGGKIRRHPRPQARAAAAAAKAAAAASASEPPMLKERKVKDRLRVLGRLVPGCRKLQAPDLLEEAADYVAALEMQVKAMRALADALAAAQLSSNPQTDAAGDDDEAEMER